MLRDKLLTENPITIDDSLFEPLTVAPARVMQAEQFVVAMAEPGSCILVTNPTELHHLRLSLSAENVKVQTDLDTITLVRSALLKDPLIRTTPKELAADLWAL